jgi:hypothetical protein
MRGSVESVRWHGEHPLDELGMLRVAQRSVMLSRKICRAGGPAVPEANSKQQASVCSVSVKAAATASFPGRNPRSDPEEEATMKVCRPTLLEPYMLGRAGLLVGQIATAPRVTSTRIEGGSAAGQSAEIASRVAGVP